MNTRIQEIIDSLELKPHPEGGYFNEIFRSSHTLESPNHQKIRNSVTNIYFLLTKGQVSRFHKVSHDEIWHFLEGDELELIELENKGLAPTHHILGSRTGKPNYQHCIRAENWQAAKCTGEYSLVGCTVAPGFDFEDFKFLTESTELTQELMLNQSALIPFL